MMKEFYDKDGKEIVYDINEPFGGGLFGRVYKVNDNECLKLYFNSAYRDSKNYIEAFETLKNINLANFYEIYQILYDSCGYLVGYTMRYYDKKDINILDMPMDYLLENFNKLYEAVFKISREGIVMEDLHAGNILLTKNDMVIIDADEYHFDSSPVMYRNKQALYTVFRDILLSALSKYYKSIDDKVRYMRAIEKLFNQGNGTKDINKKLVRYKKPIDYLRLNLNK